MKALFTICVFSILAGLAFGASWAYFEVPGALELGPSSPIEERLKSRGESLPLAKAELSETVFSFGKIERGTSMSHAFKVRNIGHVPLELQVASTTCKCTVGDLENNKVAPGEETEIVLEWVAKTAPGPFRHGAVLSTNDPSQPSIELTVEGKVVESTSMSPSDLVLGTIQAGDLGQASLYLMSFLDDQQIEVSDYELSNEQLAEAMEVNFEPAKPDELPSEDAVGGVKVTVSYQSGKTIGPFRAWLTMKTNIPQAERLTVPVMGRVVGDTSITGRGWNARRGLLMMGSFSSDEGQKTSLRIAIRGKRSQGAQWTVAEVDPPELKASLGEARKINEQMTHMPLTVEVPAGTRPMVRMGEPISSDAYLILRADKENVPDVRLRVRFTVE